MFNILKGEIVKYGFTKDEFARKVVGISRQSFSKKINGEVDFKLSEVIKILNFLNSRSKDFLKKTDLKESICCDLNYIFLPDSTLKRTE